LAQKGYDAAYGARPLRRAVVQMVEDALSTELLEGKIQSGDRITALADGETVIFKKTE